MKVQLVDPRADTPPYDHALAGALVAAGAEVELITSRFVHGVRPPAEGFDVIEHFYGRATARPLPRPVRGLLRAVEHGPDMLRYRRRSPTADVRHYQWLPYEPLDCLLLPPDRPRVLTVHNTLRRGEGRMREAVTRRLVGEMDGLVVHAQAGARELIERFGADPSRVHVIPHGAFDYLTRLAYEDPLPSELEAVDAPVILFFGLVRPYKGVDVLLEAFAELDGAELWIVGQPLLDMAPLRTAAAGAHGTVRFVERFVTDPEIPAFFRRADVVVLPYRSIDQSGVLYTALAFGKALVLSDVGGFAEIGAEHGAASLVAPEQPEALRNALGGLLADPAQREALAARAAAAAAGPFAWGEIGRRTLSLYEGLLT